MIVNNSSTVKVLVGLDFLSGLYKSIGNTDESKFMNSIFWISYSLVLPNFIQAALTVVLEMSTKPLFYEIH